MAQQNHNDNNNARTRVVLTKGTMVSHYRIIKRIGAGGMGEVYLAEDTELERKVALKFLPQHMCQDEECRKRFRREAQAAAKLSHPNIITIYDVGDYRGRPFFAMEHVEGQSLRECLAGKELSSQKIIDLGIQICGGLQAAHDRGITHRDIKPSNIFIDSYGRAKVLDFGLAAVRGGEHLTKTGSTLGTIGYMSPEQVRGEDIDHRSDLFSLGVVLYELITGLSPFKQDSEAATLHAIIQETPQPLARYRRDVPDSLQSIIEKALDKNVETRYQHADGLAADLKRLLASGPESVTVSAREKRAKKLRWAVILSLLIIAAVSAGFLLRHYLAPGELRVKSLAVLFFDNLGTEDESYLANGLAEDLAIKLRNITGFRVASSADIRRLSKKDLLAKDVASHLGVQYALGGSFLRKGEQIRISVELIDEKTGDVIWSDQFNREFKEVFQFIDEVSQRIAQALEVHLIPAEQLALKAQPTESTEAYDHYLKGRYYYYNVTFRDNELAEKEFQRALQLDPDYPLALAGLADAYVQRYKERFDYDEYWLDSSKVLIERALELESDLAEAYESRAEVLMEEDNITGALEAAQKARDLRPDWDEPYVHLGDIYRKRGERNTAMALFDTALSLRPSVDALCGKGNIFQTRGQMDSARAAYQAAQELNPNHDRTYLELGKLNEELLEGVESERLYRHAIEVRPDHATGYELLSQRMYYRGSIQEGEDLLRGFVERFPYNWDGYEALYNYLAWWIGDYPAAFKVVEESLNRNPNRVWPHLLLASSYAEKMSPEKESDKLMPESEKAVLAVDRALALRPNSGRVLEWAGAIYYYLNRLEEALDYCNQAIELRPGSSEMLATIAFLLIEMEEYEKSVFFARAAIEQSPGVVNYYYYLRYALLPLNRGQELFDIIQQATEKYGEDPYFLIFLSKEHRLAGNFKEAVNTAQRALTIKTAGWGGFEQLAIALWLSGNVEGALSNFKKEIDMYPTAYWIVSVLKSEGRFEEIESYLESIKVETPAHVSGIDHWAEVASSYYMSMRQFDDALAVYTEYRESGKETWSVDNTMAMARSLRQKGAIDSSRQLLEELIQTATGADQPHILRDLSLLRAIGSRDLEPALKLVEQASDKQNKPDSYITETLLRIQFASGRLEEIGETIERGKDIVVSPSFLYHRAQLAAVTGLGNEKMFLEQAISNLTRMSRGEYSSSYLCNASPFRALTLARAGKPDEAVREIKRAIKLEPERADIAYYAACAHSLLGDTTLALQWLETAVERGYLELWWARADPDLDPMRELPRFKEIMKKWDNRIQAMIAKSEKANE